ncbi:hypothetical protein KAFR_0D05100 [Kazachstania africana CBS 2517]|uniref:SGNH hydrolase-type esterase domain-containing protein n=1 Tax=Kazachstania africana (strain ATCC 22294 / BCRC 22015 / CBS 2517 / CECT 1963 / NBRC 1671 / NRRL Y-8276) TaxID=1071382 RepID=H2AUV7_KAZAF|nr:hypothetical protein KAFR_0D05100 [Kazachstania africana CBS 2517]CCF58157.1 hypothetical protein KAFR_0D05100 [Kazachstania africana CBS 2517]
MSVFHNDTFLLFGDSITEFSFNPKQDGIASLLSNVYVRKLDILVRGFSGYNSRWCLKLLPKVLENESSIVMGTIFFGANDSCLGGHQRVPLSEFVENIRQMVQLMKGRGIKPIIIGPGMIDQSRWEDKTNENRMFEIANGYIRTLDSFAEYSNALVRLSIEENVPFVNLNDAFQRYEGDWRNLLEDGLHFSSLGYKIFFDELLKTIETYYPEYSPTKLPYKFPNWREVSEAGSSLENLP